MEPPRDPLPPIQDLCLDAHRAARTGFPEVVFGAGKTPEQIAQAARAILAQGERLLVTRLGPEALPALREAAPDVRHEVAARCGVVDRRRVREEVGCVALLTAGTSDVPVAEEARVTLELMGNRVLPGYDVGVAGLHRLLALRERLAQARVIVVVAGMDGVLPSVVGGLVGCPVVAVPTSVGYGASFGGVAALLTMLNSCAPGVVVVNIDNGFGGAVAASRINRAAAGASP